MSTMVIFSKHHSFWSLQICVHTRKKKGADEKNNSLINWSAKPALHLEKATDTEDWASPDIRPLYNTIQYNTIRVYCENTLSYNNGVLSQTEPKSGSEKARQLIYRYPTNTIKLGVKKLDMEYSIIKNYNNKILISISYIINTKFNKKASKL